ncbi:putative thiol peroxidase [Corynebacterium felinum]|nr:putative thiol peroxidase [Corynebacterium felinum]
MARYAQSDYAVVMAKTHFKGTEANTNGNLPEVGSTIPEFSLVGADLADITNATLAGKRVIFNIFPSIDTGICAQSVRRFNEAVTKLDNTAVVCASADLPFAHARFCGAEGIDNVMAGSGFRSSFGEDFGVLLTDSPLQGLYARAVIVTDVDGTVLHTELVEEIGTEPTYSKALEVLEELA